MNNGGRFDRLERGCLVICSAYRLCQRAHPPKSGKCFDWQYPGFCISPIDIFGEWSIIHRQKPTAHTLHIGFMSSLCFSHSFLNNPSYFFPHCLIQSSVAGMRGSQPINLQKSGLPGRASGCYLSDRSFFPQSIMCPDSQNSSRPSITQNLIAALRSYLLPFLPKYSANGPFLDPLTVDRVELCMFCSLSRSIIGPAWSSAWPFSICVPWMFDTIGEVSEFTPWSVLIYNRILAQSGSFIHRGYA